MLSFIINYFNPAYPGLLYYPNFYFSLPYLKTGIINNWINLNIYNTYVNSFITDDDKNYLLSQIDGRNYFLWWFGDASIFLNYKGFYFGIENSGGSYLSTKTNDPIEFLFNANSKVDKIYDLSIEKIQALSYIQYFLGYAFRYRDFIFGLRMNYLQTTPYIEISSKINLDNHRHYISNIDTINIKYFAGGDGFSGDLGILYEPKGKGWFAGFNLRNLISSINFSNTWKYPFYKPDFSDSIWVIRGYFSKTSDTTADFVKTDSFLLYIYPEEAFELSLIGHLDEVNVLRLLFSDTSRRFFITNSVYRRNITQSYRLPTILYIDFGYKDLTDRYGFNFSYIQGFNETFISTRKPKFLASAFYKVFRFLPLGFSISIGGREKIQFGFNGGLDFNYWFLNAGWDWSRGFTYSAKGHTLYLESGFKSPIRGKLEIRIIDSLTNNVIANAEVNILRGTKQLLKQFTNYEGKVISNLSPDKYRIEVSARNYIPKVDSVEVIPKILNTKVIKLLPAGGLLNIVVLDSLKGDTLKNVRVVVNDSAYEYNGGILKVFAKEGDAQIKAYKDRYKDYYSVVSVKIGDSINKTILMSPKFANLVVKVFDERTKQPLSASIKLLRNDSIIRDITSEVLNVELEDGNYKLLVSKEGYSQYSDVLTMKGGVDLTKEVYLRSDIGYLLVEVIDRTTGEHLANAQVSIVSEKGDTLSKAITDNSGKYETSLGKGLYKIIAQKEEYLPNSDFVQIQKDSRNKVVIPLTPKFAIIYGLVLDAEKGFRVKAKIDVKRDNNIITTIEGDSYYLKLDAGYYVFEVRAKDYAPRVADIQLNNGEKYRRDFLLTRVGQVFTFRNIYFDFNKATIRRESYPVLDSIYEFLAENPTIVVEVAGHADERGGYEYNIRLTQARANAVVDYLVRKGINPNRLIPKGYGWTQPVVKGAKTEREHQLNRRVEFRIIRELEGQ
ncbi:MAG: OmpA family protein [candidate division WOR-3 bacterium]|nr:OmpA family protein [candidate division WOR-3 bacterium]MDW8150595.1 OmpA family protein [candidate division WOR-3 bacterium]